MRVGGRTWRWAACCLALAGAARGGEGAAPPRVGWEEGFDVPERAERWRAAAAKPVFGTPLPEVSLAGGALKMVSSRGALDPQMKRPDWPEWPAQPASDFTNLQVAYDEEVDLDAYPYLVVRILEKSTFFFITFNDRETKIAYTTGVHAQDLRALGLKGKLKPAFHIQFNNTSGYVKLDYLRLVRELDVEEKKGLLGPGCTVREERLAPKPYQGLEALNARAGGPARREPRQGEWCVFRDSATHAEVWKMTATPANEHKVAFNCDGSAFTVHGRTGQGFHVYDWPSRSFKLIEGGLSDAAPRFSTTEPSVMVIATNKTLQAPRRRLTLLRHDFRSGARTEFASFETEARWAVQELHSSPDSSKLLFGFRETPTVFLIDPELPEPAQRCREITLPTRLKGVTLQNHDREIHWYNCYTYEPHYLDLESGAAHLGNACMAGGHAAMGPHATIGPYGERLKLLVKNGLHPQTEADAGDARIFGNYREPLQTDYGTLSRDGKWLATDGLAGDVKGQHLLISTADPAAVLRVCTHFTSRNDWVTNTYSSTSPDATKLAWVSDMLGDGELYLAVTGWPAAPGALSAKRTGEGNRVALAWKAPEGSREVAGYRIYRSAKSGKEFTALNREPLNALTFADESAPPGPVFYMVATSEPSGLEGYASGEAAVDAEPGGARLLWHEAEACVRAAPVREVLDGLAGGSRYVRIHRASDDEPADGALRLQVRLPAGTYVLWLRGRAEGESGPWRVQLAPGGGTLGPATEVLFEKSADGARPEFAWVRCEAEIPLAEERTLDVCLSASTPGLALDQFTLSCDPGFEPGRAAPPGPWLEAPGPAEDLTAEPGARTVTLRWKPSRSSSLARYDIYVGGTDDPASLGNATILGSTTGTEFVDQGWKPGARLVYRVVAVDARGFRAPPTAVDALTEAQAVETVAADVARANLDPRCVTRKEEKLGLTLATLPALDEAGRKAGPAKIVFPFEVKEDAEYLLWVRYAPAFRKELKVQIELDGKPAGAFALRAPYRPMGQTLASARAGAARAFTDKLVLNGQELFRLAPGAHTLAILLDPELGEAQHGFAGVWASSDWSFRPEGYDPRADFTKE